MQITKTIKLYPTKEQYTELKQQMREYIGTVNRIVREEAEGINTTEHTGKILGDKYGVKLNKKALSSCIQDMKSIVKKHMKAVRKYDHKLQYYNDHKEQNPKLCEPNKPKVPQYTRLIYKIDNQGFAFKGKYLDFCIYDPPKPGSKVQSKRILIKTKITDDLEQYFQSQQEKKKLNNTKPYGGLTVVIKGNNLFAEVPVDVEEKAVPEEGNIMGVDLGLNCPAVSWCSDGSSRFYGDGKKQKLIRRRYYAKRKDMQELKALKSVEQLGKKEQQIMKYIDHNISRQIINTAKEHGVNVIKMEELKNIRNRINQERNAEKQRRKAKTVKVKKFREGTRFLNNWSFGRLFEFIQYKAKMEGIEVRLIRPNGTSQTCPKCNFQHKAEPGTRKWICPWCGFSGHRDLVGAINICQSTNYV